MVGTHEPCRLIPGRALEGHSQSPAWAWLNLAATRPRDPYLLFNHRDTRLIPGDTPMTEKRRPSLLPRVPSRHITDLRHTLSFGSRRGYEAPVNSYLTGASPIFLGLRSRTGRWRPPRSSRAKPTLVFGSNCWSGGVFRASLLHSSAAPLRRSRNWCSRLAQRSLKAESFVALRATAKQSRRFYWKLSRCAHRSSHSSAAPSDARATGLHGSRTGRWRPPRSSRARNTLSASDLTAGLEVCSAHRSCTRRRRPSDARETGLHGSRNGPVFACSLRSLRCSLVAALFVRPGRTSMLSHLGRGAVPGLQSKARSDH